MRAPLLLRVIPAGCALALTAAVAHGAASVQTVESAAHDALVDALAPALAVRGGTAIVNVAPPDGRRSAAPCARLEGFLPPGARLTGRTLVGVRCAEGGPWQAFVPADARVDAPTWQATRALRAGDTVATGDVALAVLPLTATDLDVALSAARSGTVRTGTSGLASLDGREAPPIGRVVLRPVAMGRALTVSDVRDAGRVNAGETVRVIYQGAGFAVASEGRLIASADPGGSVQVRLAGGNVVSGLLRADHQVELPR